MKISYPQYLVETDWLASHLDDPNLRILDCSVLFNDDGRAAWERGHIPGSCFADVMHELSDPISSLPFTLPQAMQFAEAVSRYGIGNENFVVLYDASADSWAHIWAARVWWLINALTAKEHAGEKSRYGRAGHIPSSANVPAVTLTNPVTHAYLPPDQLRACFEKSGAFERDRVITYCGGGIAACSDAFVLTMLGHSDVAVYDGSLMEWAADRDLPMKTGE